jgi:hypothetical protein
MGGGSLLAALLSAPPTAPAESLWVELRETEREGWDLLCLFFVATGAATSLVAFAA